MATADARPVSAHDVVALIFREQQNADLTVDKMQLEKWLYLIQGAHLVLWDCRAFREPLHAYKNGPVVKVVEETYREVTRGKDPLPHAVGGDPSNVPDDVAETTRLVLRYFGTWSAPDLEKFVKRPGAPWRTVRGDLPESADSSLEMELDLLTSWFRRNGVGPNPAHLSNTDKELFARIAAGDTDALSSLF